MYSPKHYGLSVKNGELTELDKTYIDTTIRCFSNFKDTANLASLRKQYDLPDGGQLIVQNMGGVLRAIVDKKPIRNTLTDSKEDNFYIPMLFCGCIDGSNIEVINDLKKVKLTISSTTQKRLAHYKYEENEEPKDPIQIKLERFNIKINTEVVPEFDLDDDNKPYATQYDIQRPTWYSGAMAEVMQIVGGYGKQPNQKQVKLNDKTFEKIQMQFPASVSDSMQKQISGLLLPGYTGRPNKDGQFQYDYKFSNTHAVGFNADGEPWLLRVSKKDGFLYAMPLPVIPETTTKAFKLYITDKEDNELRMIVDKFGGMPSGESFPTNTEEFKAWERAGIIIKLCDMQDFYDNKAYSETCGWSFNTDASEGVNTCHTIDSNGFMVGRTYKLNITLGKSAYKNSMATKTDVPAENIEAVNTYMSKLTELINEYDEVKRKAIRFKLRRSLQILIERSKLIFENSEIDFWNDLKIDPIAECSASLSKISEGYLMIDPNNTNPLVNGAASVKAINLLNKIDTDFENESFYSSVNLAYNLLKDGDKISSFDGSTYSASFTQICASVYYEFSEKFNKVTKLSQCIRFPKLGKKNKFDHFYIPSYSKYDNMQKSDTTVFAYFVNNTIKFIDFYQNSNNGGNLCSTDFKGFGANMATSSVADIAKYVPLKQIIQFKYIDENEPKIKTTPQPTTNNNAPNGNFYSSDFDHRSYDEFYWTVDGSRSCSLVASSSGSYKSRYFQFTYRPSNAIFNFQNQITLTIPYFCRDNAFINTQKYTPLYAKKGLDIIHTEFVNDMYSLDVENYGGYGSREFQQKNGVNPILFDLEDGLLDLGNSDVLAAVNDAKAERDKLIPYGRVYTPVKTTLNTSYNSHPNFNNLSELKAIVAKGEVVCKTQQEIYDAFYNKIVSYNNNDIYLNEGAEERFKQQCIADGYDHNEFFDIGLISYFSETGSLVSIYDIAKTWLKNPKIKECKLYGTVFGEAKEIKDVTDRETYFRQNTEQETENGKKEVCLNYAQSTFGSKKYAKVGLSDDVADVVSYGTTKLCMDSDDVCFIGIINE